MTLRHLDPVDPIDAPEGGAGPDHPMRQVTREVAFEDRWTPERARRVADLFDGLAPDWNSRDTPGREAPLLDALRRGDLPRGRCVEVGAGTGIATRDLAREFEQVVAVDLAMAMLHRLPPSLGHRVRADAARLPVRDRSVDVVALHNALLFPREIDRALRPDGAVLWVNTLGEATPIHLSADEVRAALPGQWEGVASRAGHGTWCVLRRAHP